MSMTIQFCEDRATEAASAAAGAKLDNVRNTALRSEAAWLAMASRLRMVETQREKHRMDRLANPV